MEKDCRHPSLSLAQLTLSQLVRQLMTKPQQTPTHIGIHIVSGYTRQFTKVKTDVSSSAASPALPTSMTENLSERKALSMAPIIHPPPSIISKYPTLRSVLMSMEMSLLMYMLMNPVTSPSRMIIANMQAILGQQSIEDMKIAFACTHFGCFIKGTTNVPDDTSPSLKSDSGWASSLSPSRKRVQMSQEIKLSTDRMIKQVELPKYPNPKVVTMAPNRLLPYTMPLVMPKYFPSSSLEMPQRLNNFIRYPP